MCLTVRRMDGKVLWMVEAPQGWWCVRGLCCTLGGQAMATGLLKWTANDLRCAGRGVRKRGGAIVFSISRPDPGPVIVRLFARCVAADVGPQMDIAAPLDRRLKMTRRAMDSQVARRGSRPARPRSW